MAENETETIDGTTEETTAPLDVKENAGAEDTSTPDAAESTGAEDAGAPDVATSANIEEASAPDAAESADDNIADEPVPVEVVDSAEFAAPSAGPDSQAAAVAAAGPSKASGSSMTKVYLVVGIVAALLLGLLIGGFVFKGASGGNSALSGKTSLTESELGSEIASLTFNGKTQPITVKEVIEQTSSLAAAKDSSGNYAVPSADSVLTVARNKVLLADAESRGITVTDDDVAEFAKKQLGTSDFTSIGANYGMDEASVMSLLRESCLMSKLRDSVMGDTQSAKDMPELPREPTAASASSSASSENEENADEAEVDEAAAADSLEYFYYVTALAGDEWDAKNNKWASTSGPYYQALKSYEVSPTNTSYETAMVAYYVAYQAYSESSSETTEQWADYVNGLLDKASVTINTLLA